MEKASTCLVHLILHANYRYATSVRRFTVIAILAAAVSAAAATAVVVVCVDADDIDYFNQTAVARALALLETRSRIVNLAQVNRSFVRATFKCCCMQSSCFHFSFACAGFRVCASVCVYGARPPESGA